MNPIIRKSWWIHTLIQYWPAYLVWGEAPIYTFVLSLIWKSLKCDSKEAMSPLMDQSLPNLTFKEIIIQLKKPIVFIF